MSKLQIRTKTDALLVIDVQNDFCPGGALAVPDGDQVVGPCNKLIDKFATVIFSQDWHVQGHQSFASSHPGKQQFDEIALPYGSQTLWPDHCIQGSQGAEFHPDINLNRADLIIRKGCRPQIDSYSAFCENDHVTTTGLGGYLQQRGIGRLFMCGLAADYCVAFSALDGVKQGFDVTVVSDATRAIGGQHYDAIQMAQLEAGILLADSEILI